jgi:hypothetical protein
MCDCHFGCAKCDAEAEIEARAEELLEETRRLNRECDDGSVEAEHAGMRADWAAYGRPY